MRSPLGRDLGFYSAGSHAGGLLERADDAPRPASEHHDSHALQHGI